MIGRRRKQFLTSKNCFLVEKETTSKYRFIANFRISILVSRDEILRIARLPKFVQFNANTCKSQLEDLLKLSKYHFLEPEVVPHCRDTHTHTRKGTVPEVFSWDPLGFCRDRPSDISLHTHKGAHHSENSLRFEISNLTLVSFSPDASVVGKFSSTFLNDVVGQVRLGDSLLRLSVFLKVLDLQGDDGSRVGENCNFDTLICSSPS